MEEKTVEREGEKKEEEEEEGEEQAKPSSKKVWNFDFWYGTTKFEYGSFVLHD